jgi:hypothetical protein
MSKRHTPIHFHVCEEKRELLKHDHILCKPPKTSQFIKQNGGHVGLIIDVLL